MRKRAWRRHPSTFKGCSRSPGHVKTSRDIRAFLASAKGHHWHLGGRWARGSSPIAGNMCWVLAGLGPAGSELGGRAKLLQCRHIPPIWEAMRGHAYLLAVTGHTHWGLITGSSIASEGSWVGVGGGGTGPGRLVRPPGGWVSQGPVPRERALGDAILSPAQPGFILHPTLRPMSRPCLQGPQRGFGCVGAIMWLQGGALSCFLVFFDLLCF